MGQDVGVALTEHGADRGALNELHAGSFVTTTIAASEAERAFGFSRSSGVLARVRCVEFFPCFGPQRACNDKQAPTWQVTK